METNYSREFLDLLKSVGAARRATALNTGALSMSSMLVYFTVVPQLRKNRAPGRKDLVRGAKNEERAVGTRFLTIVD
jgi:hypothetical protein